MEIPSHATQNLPRKTWRPGSATGANFAFGWQFGGQHPWHLFR